MPPKKEKEPKKDNKDASAPNSRPSTAGKEKPPKEILVIQDMGTFYHDTGDVYEGGFEAKKKDMSVKMHGIGCRATPLYLRLYPTEDIYKKSWRYDSNPYKHVVATFKATAGREEGKGERPGKYTTNEGDSYEGNWQYNTLVGIHDNVTITYQDGSTYIGQFKNWAYNGSGSYIYPDEAEIRGDFIDNCPVGNLELEDPNGRTWLGKTQPGFCWFRPVNHYFEDLKFKKALARLTTRATPN